MVQVLFEYQGTLDKFLGDGVLALFGTPLAQPDHPQRAVQVALDMQRAAAGLNATRQRRGQPTLHIGIGINSGEAIVGNIGSEKRMEYTVIGDMVNVAQRLQGSRGWGRSRLEPAPCHMSSPLLLSMTRSRLKSKDAASLSGRIVLVRVRWRAREHCVPGHAADMAVSPGGYAVGSSTLNRGMVRLQ